MSKMSPWRKWRHAWRARSRASFPYKELGPERIFAGVLPVRGCPPFFPKLNARVTWLVIPLSPVPLPYLRPASPKSQEESIYGIVLFTMVNAKTISEDGREFAYTGKVLKKISFLRDRVEDWQNYPFSVPSIRSLKEIDLKSRACFFVGENGSGKSTLLEALAVHYGFGREGGTRSFFNNSTETNRAIDPLVRALRLSFDRRTGAGFFLRAECLFNVASHIDQSDEEQLGFPGTPIASFYGNRSLHARSHGEAFFTLFDLKCQRNGLFLLDEPEAALSAQRQLAFLALLHKTLRRFHDAQFIISTHSPLLLGLPGAQIRCRLTTSTYTRSLIRTLILSRYTEGS